MIPRQRTVHCLKSKQVKLFKILLLLAAVYFLIAALCHFFGWTIFPFYDGSLYTPYHDTLLALCDLIFFMLFLVVAKDPVKNIDTLNVMIVGLFLAIIFNLGIIWKIDFAELGSIEKKLQTIAETSLAAVVFVILIILKLKQPKLKN